MNRKAWMILKILLVMAILIGAGYGIYRLGYAQGVVSNFSVEELATLQKGLMYYGPRSSIFPHDIGFSRIGYGMMGGFGAVLRGLLVIFAVGCIINMTNRRRMMRHAFMMKFMDKDFEGFDGKPPWRYYDPCRGFGWKKEKEDNSAEEGSSKDTSAE